MNKFFKFVNILAVITLSISACSLLVVQAQPEEQTTQKAIPYQTMLGKSIGDMEVADFIVNNCASAGQFQVCKDVGMALWTDASQIIGKVYLYAGRVDGFKRYRGELPFGLSFYDPMWKVEEQLRKLGTDEIAQAALETGLPDEGSSPDHIHYWAVYKRFNVVIIYDTPFADEDAYIYAIVINY
jgi:hypothetical protein